MDRQKKKKSSNKDVNRLQKYQKKKQHINSVAKSKSKSEKKREKEKYMRQERNYNHYFMKNIIQNNYMYKMKDYIVDWYINNVDINDEKFWDHIGCNENALFMYYDNKHFRCIREHCVVGIFQNENAGVISELILEDLLKNIPEEKDLWRIICANGNKNVIRILEDNIEKYSEKYGEYYSMFYDCLCENKNAVNVIKNYFDTMFYFDTNDVHIHRMFRQTDNLYNLCRNENVECLKLIEPYLNLIDTDDRYYYYKSALLRNPSAISLIEKMESIDDDLFLNTNAIHLIKNIYETDPENVPWIHLCLNSNANELLKNIPETEICYSALAWNENGVDLLEKAYNENKIQCLDDKHNSVDKYRILNRLYTNPGAIGFFERNKQFLRYSILSNPGIFEINYEYLQRKIDYVTHDEEKIIIKYVKHEIDTLEPRLLKKANTDYITQQEIETVIENYKKKEKYLPEHELIFRISEERLMKAVFSPRRVMHNLEVYNYNICLDEYWDHDEYY